MAFIATKTATQTATSTPTPTTTPTTIPTPTATATATATPTCIFVFGRALLYNAKGFYRGGRNIQIIGQGLCVFPRLIRERASFVHNGRVR